MPPDATSGPAEYCPNCSLWHAGGPCTHDPDLACFEPGCKRPRGFRWLDSDRQEVKPRTRCWHCWHLATFGFALPPMGESTQKIQGSAQQ